MTAKECLSHEWLFDIFHSKPQCHISNGPVPEPSANCDENIEDTENNCVVKSDSRSKVIDQQSEMSLDELVSDETNVINDFVHDENSQGIEDVKQVENGSENVHTDQSSELEINMDSNTNDTSEKEKCDTETFESGIHSAETDKESSDIPAKETISDIQRGMSVSEAVVNSATCASVEDITPDTDSSMCISEIKAHETDSGMVTGSDSKSGRESVELDLLGEEHDLFAETNEDSDMLSKSMVETSNSTSDVKSSEQDAKMGDSIADVNEDQGLVSADTSAVSQTDESEQMDHEHSDTVFESSALETETNNSTNIMKTSDLHSKPSQSGVISPAHYKNTPVKNNHRGQNFNQSANSDISLQSFGESPNVSSSTPIKQSLGGSPGLRPSLGSIDDSINSMQLGESLKRGMCNDSTTSGNTGNNEEEEYEFISVSKRVRSIEDSITTPRSPSFSPKIARSPRVPRHSRLHHQHH